MEIRRILIGVPLLVALSFVVEAPSVLQDTGVMGARPALAQRTRRDDKKPRRRTKTVDSLRANIYEKIAKAQEKLEKPEERADGIKALRKLLEGKLNDYEEAIVHQIFGQIYIDDAKYKDAIREFGAILNLERVPESLTITSLQALAQLYLITEEYRKSIEYMNKWLAYQENPGPTPYSFLAQAYYGLEDYKNIIVNARKAIDLAQEQGLEVKENWWLLLRLAYFELGDMKKVAEVLETLAVNYDKPEYWLQLAGVYSELGEEKKQLAAMEVAYRRGYITTENNLRNLAQLYLYHNVPIKAAWVIEKGLKDGIIEKSAKIYKLLGQAYLNAQEMEKAKKPLELAAEEKDDGDIWMRVGQVYAELEQWKQAIDPLQKAIDSKDLKEPGYAYLLLGMAYFYIDQFDKSKKALHKARTFKYTRKSARQWIAFVDEEVKRRKQLTAYYGGGQ